MMRMEMEQGVGEAKRAVVGEGVGEQERVEEAVKERVGESNDKQ